MKPTSGSAGAGRRIRVLLAVSAAVLLAGALAAVAWRLSADSGTDITVLSPGDAAKFLRSWGPWSALGSVALMVLHSFVPLPAEIIAMANGMVFGPWLGVMLTWVGAMLGRPFVRLLVAETRWRAIDGLRVSPGALLLARLVPVISFNLVNYAAGLLGVGWWTFSWTTALGILPLTIAAVVLGGRLLAAPLWTWGLVALALAALWLLWRRWRG
jgi:uncharacterized membrane protein YdjX (TVP38/TMEM64 family)